jgi:hypothetical protein
MMATLTVAAVTVLLAAVPAVGTARPPAEVSDE